MEQEISPASGFRTEESFQEIRLLAQRLTAELGELDDEAIQAVAEATGAPENYVRLAIQASEPGRKKSAAEQLRGSFFGLSPEVRRVTVACVIAVAAGLFLAIAAAARDRSGLFDTLALVGGLGGLWNAAIAKTSRSALVSGVLLGGIAIIVRALFGFIFGLLPGLPTIGSPPWLLIVGIVASGFLGVLANLVLSNNRRALGMKDPVEERQVLLRQLQDIQERLRSDQRFVTFVSVDIVGSTRIKAESDELDVEYTFSEYHRFVESIAKRFQGQVHSTAGDGVTCVFENPVQAFKAGKALLAGLFEFNAFRNKLSRPIEVRAGIHTGSVLAPGQNLQSVNFAHVIDIAAHMQKAAEPGSFVVSASTAHYLPGGIDALGTARILVDDFEAAIWVPASRLEIPAVLAAPALE